MSQAFVPRALVALALLVPLVCTTTGCSKSVDEQIGKPAPEIEGEDLDGAEMTLSEFRGQVVLLEFWGNWWGPCRSLYPHTRAFLERFADEPFAVVGVNSDTQHDLLRMVMEKQKITWPSFTNGEKGVTGPISHAWGVSEWPTLFVIDAKGVIRYRSTKLDIPELEELLPKLFEEAGSKQASVR
ncbi:MAG: TlpA family protein disulfide reductase [Planctomycetes bacterium]|nr:TlpA family protein disulfide reductase [Planctomycetota bacterium]